jgi:hypothetical protein
MSVDRRDFMKTVGAGAAFGVASSDGLFATGKRWSQPGEITVEDLRPHVGQKFDVKCPVSGNSMQLKLTEVTTNPAWERTQTGEPRPSEFRQPFCLLFERVGTETVEDGCHDISHSHLKTANLYLSRICHTGRKFEVCFS